MLVQKKYIPSIFLRGYRAAELRVNTRKDNIGKDIIKIALMTTRTELNLINIQS